MTARRHILYVTGTRAEFGLMASTLRAIQRHRALALQLVVTGMHLDARLGNSLRQIRADGWGVDAVVPWPVSSAKSRLARDTGNAIAKLAGVYARLRPDIVLVCGDRVEAFAGASAAQLCGIPVAHVHGGDRALGQVDDSLRHAITKLSHIHLAATDASARRIRRLGEDPWRIHTVGSPGNDSLAAETASWSAVSQAFPHMVRRQYAVLAYHPTSADAAVERDRATLLLAAVRERCPQVVLIKPNNDPGCRGILRAWSAAARVAGTTVVGNLPRALYLGLLAHCALLIGNSSSGLLEAPTLNVPVIDVGDRQLGRERSAVVRHCALCQRDLGRTLRLQRPTRRAANPYRGDGAAGRIAEVLASTPLDARLLAKLIAY